MPKQQKWTLANKLSVIVLTAWLLFTAIEVARMLLGYEDLTDENRIPTIGFGLVGWAFIYAVFSEVNKTFKRILGIGELLVGFGLMVVQLYDMKGQLTRHDLAWRWTVIIGSVAVMSKGMKDLIRLKAKNGELSDE
jgi:hypothetical protein